MLPRALRVLLLAALPACSLALDVDRFEPTAAVEPTSANRHLQLSVGGFDTHLRDRIEFRVVDQNQFLRLLGIVEPLGPSGDATFFITNGIPPVTQGPFRIDLYGDKNANRAFDGPGTPDHSWRIENITGDNVPGANASDAVWEIQQIHNQSWQDFPPTRDTGLGATISFANMDRYLGLGSEPGRTLELRIADASSANTVAFYRAQAIQSASFEAKFPGVIEEGGSYDVLVWVDANGSGGYDNPARGGDHGFRVRSQATVTGLALTIDPREEIPTVDFGPRF